MPNRNATNRLASGASRVIALMVESGLPGCRAVGDGFAEPVDRGLQAGGDFRQRARHVGCGVDGALGHAGLKRRFGVSKFTVFMPSSLRSRCDEAATFGYPRAR